MSIHDKVDDWQIIHIAQVGGASYVGAGVYFFQFKSVQADMSELFVFGGGGLGLGGSMGGGTWDASPMELVHIIPFSVLDLHGCYGLIAAGGVGLGYGVGGAVFSAKRTNSAGAEEVLFLGVEAGGASGVALGGHSLVGRWNYARKSIEDYVANPIGSAGRWLQEQLR